MNSFSSVLLLSAILSIIFPLSSHGGGSFLIEDILPLLQQNKDLSEFVAAHLDLESGGWAARIGNRVNENLGGARIAPYSIRAKPKGSPGPWTFELIIEAETEFLDSKGNAVSLEKGESIREKLLGIKLIPLSESERK